MFERATATAGAIETPPPDAPVSASVLMSCAALARSVRSRPLITAVPVMEAVVVSSTRLSATEAPMPSLLAPFVPPFAGSAFAIDRAFEAALSSMAPEPAATVPLIVASLLRWTMLRARDPATPTLPPPAPEVAVAAKSSRPSPELVTSARTVAGPFAVPATVAELVTVA